MSVKSGMPEKGGLMSEGILTLVPVPILNSPPLIVKGLVKFSAKESDFCWQWD